MNRKVGKAIIIQLIVLYFCYSMGRRKIEKNNLTSCLKNGV